MLDFTVGDELGKEVGEVVGKVIGRRIGSIAGAQIIEQKSFCNIALWLLNHVAMHVKDPRQSEPKSCNSLLDVGLALLKPDFGRSTRRTAGAGGRTGRGN